MGFLTDELRKLEVWAKGTPIPSRKPTEWRMDAKGSYMFYADYGKQADFGWHIDHIDPNGPDELWNLQPLYWLNNLRKSDQAPLSFALEALGLSGKK
jgi:hypothetical protein